MPHIPDKQAARGMVDELGQLDDQITIWQPSIARAAELRKMLQGYFVDDPGDQQYTLEGDRYTAVFGFKSWKHTINTKTLFKRIGATKFLENCDFTLKALERVVTDTTGIVSAERVGPRTVKAALREPASAAAGREPHSSARRPRVNNSAVPTA